MSQPINEAISSMMENTIKLAIGLLIFFFSSQLTGPFMIKAKTIASIKSNNILATLKSSHSSTIMIAVNAIIFVYNLSADSLFSFSNTKYFICKNLFLQSGGKVGLV